MPKDPGVGLWGRTDKVTGRSVRSECQTLQCFGYTHTKKLYVVYLKFRLKQLSCVVSSNPVLGLGFMQGDPFRPPVGIVHQGLPEVT